MPINIYNEDTSEKLAWLSDNHWDLPSQIAELEKWLINNTKSLPKAKYIIDIGFDISPDARGGGAVITSKMMKLMSDKGFDLFLSEYPNQLAE